MGRNAAIAAALLLFSSPAFAQCNVPAGFGNLFGTVADCDDSGPVTGTLQGINANGDIGRPFNDSWICLSEDQPGCGGTRSGVVGDGLIAFSGGWASPNISGCPYEPQGETLGRNFYNVTDASGNQLLLSVGRDRNSDTFAADNAWPSDSSGQILANLSCESPREDVTVVSQTIEGNSATVQLICQDPQIRSDCDPDSRGIMLDTGSCLPSDPAFLASLIPLNLYSTVSDCSGRGLNYGIGQGGWTVQSYNDLGGGIRETTVTLPPTGCVFLGCSFGNETTSTSGSCSSDGASCTVDSDCGNECNGGARDGLTCINDSDPADLPPKNWPKN